jgi:YidC/Oxa1 family membrane protein insertase
MRTELRFLLAILLMVGVLVVTNLLFPPVVPEGPTDAGDPGAAPEAAPGVATPELRRPEGTVVEEELPSEAQPAGTPATPARTVVVEGPLYRFAFSTHGARLESARLLRFPSFTRDGPVELVEPGAGAVLTGRVVSGGDTLDLRSIPFEVEPTNGLLLSAGGDEQTIRFTFRDPAGRRDVEIAYTFSPDDYLVEVAGRVSGGGTVLLTDLGEGLAFNEAREQEEVRTRAFVTHHPRNGIRPRDLTRISDVEITEGPLHWAAVRSRYFVVGMLSDRDGEGTERFLGGTVARDLDGEGRVALSVAQPLGSDGTFSYRLFAGPQDYSRLAALGSDFQEVNAYGWRFIRPILRPFVGITTTVLVWLHEKLSLGYGWVLVVFGVMMRVLLWPLNQRAMRAQFRNMAVQPLLQEAQKKYKDQPEKLQKELMKLYKEHGFNPLAGCLPLLLPWPILIALFFVFQNTIEFRGVPFLWLPDLSAPDPYFILPLFLGVSMFFLQWVSFRSMDEINPQMKFMLWFMPIFMVFIFFQFAAGLNLYYAVSNVATIPQQWWIAKERKKVKVHRPAGATG